MNIDENSYKGLAELFTAEFWAKNFAKRTPGFTPAPFGNFQFNIFKAYALYLTSQDVGYQWMNICQQLNIDGLNNVAAAGLASYYAYTEQALVVTVSATEAYFNDRLADTISKDNRTIKQYLDRKIEVKRIVETGLDLTKDIGILISETINSQNIDEVQKEYNKVYGFEPFSDNDLTQLKKIFQIRHVIVHKSGYVDHFFLSQTGLKYQIGDRLCFERNEILQMITFINKLITNLEQKIKERMVK